MPSNESHLPGYPCLYKSVCRNCTKVAIEDRPSMCVAIKCGYYTICPECHENRTLQEKPDGGVICGQCLKKKPSLAKAVLAKQEAAAAGTTQILGGDAKLRQVTITPPGEPPPELSVQESAHYNKRWKDYEGYYRNPSSYFICHMIILEEITLSYIQSEVLKSRGYLNTEWNELKNISIANLDKLTKQLPSKEAEDLLDDEKSLAMIYDAFVEEKKIRYASGVARILSPEALALAPALHYPVNPSELLRRCGFTEIEIEEVILRIDVSPAEYTPEEVLQHFGFRLREEFAQPIASPLSETQLIEDEVRLE